MPPIRLKVKVDPRDISFSEVIVIQADEGVYASVQGCTDIQWAYAPDGGGVVVLTFDATMIDFEVTPFMRAKE